jgi:hypothetical protein
MHGCVQSLRLEFQTCNLYNYQREELHESSCSSLSSPLKIVVRLDKCFDIIMATAVLPYYT